MTPLLERLVAHLAIVGAITPSLLFVGVLSAFGQHTDDPHGHEARMREHGRGGILVPTPVLDSPFSGEAVTTWRPASGSGIREVRSTARYYRDRAGRVRVEQTFVAPTRGQSPQQVVVTPDPSQRWAYLLDPVARTATRMSRSYAAGGSVHLLLPVSTTCIISFFRPGLHVPIEEELLGERSMDGVRVEGTRVRGMLHVELGHGETVDESWISRELNLEMYARSEDGEIGVVEHRVTPISRAEPPAELFEVPAGYTMVTVPRGMVSLNPYSPETWLTLPPSVKSFCGSGTPPGF
jgi:hypothetical protein